jgi:hypothetical protein
MSRSHIVLIVACALCACATLWIAGCADLHDLTGSRNTEENMAASCRNWDAMARAAAHPDAATIARHDQLAQKAAELKAAAAAQELHVAALERAAAAIAQAQIEADDVYDAQQKYRTAEQCWQGLGLVSQQHREMMRDLMNGDAATPSRQTTPIFTPGPVLSTPPSPPPAADAGITWEPPAPLPPSPMPYQPELCACAASASKWCLSHRLGRRSTDENDHHSRTTASMALQRHNGRDHF